jgi:hypothetical protein
LYRKARLKHPKLVKYNNNFVIAHDDADKVKIIMVDKLGRKLNEKVFAAEDESIRDLNLLTDGEYLYLNWIVYKNGIDSVLNLKLNKNLQVSEKWMTNDVRDSIQIGENTLVTSFNNRIEVLDVRTKKLASINTTSPSKLAGTTTKYGELITYYIPFLAGVRETNGFFYFYVKDGSATNPINIKERPMSSEELFFNTAVACDDKYGYIIVERRLKENFSSNLIVQFPLGNGPEDRSTELKGQEKGLEIFTTDQFIYSPASISSGNEARFMVGYARKYGRTTRQFNLLDFSIKDGKIARTSYVTRSREASNYPYINGDMIVYTSLVKGEDFKVYVASQNEEFKNANNGIKTSEIKLALLDIVLEFLNAVFSLFTLGLGWIIPGFVLVSVMSLFGYRIKLNRKKIFYILICMATIGMKLYTVYSLYYGTYAKSMPRLMASPAKGIIISLILSIFAYGYGYSKYSYQLKKDEDVMPILSFMLALLADSLLTQFLFTPFIM